MPRREEEIIKAFKAMTSKRRKVIKQTSWICQERYKQDNALTTAAKLDKE